jgi:hypothetical protein
MEKDFMKKSEKTPRCVWIERKVRKDKLRGNKGPETFPSIH